MVLAVETRVGLGLGGGGGRGIGYSDDAAGERGPRFQELRVCGGGVARGAHGGLFERPHVAAGDVAEVQGVAAEAGLGGAEEGVGGCEGHGGRGSRGSVRRFGRASQY